MFKKLALIIMSLGLISSTVFASPINLPTAIKNQDGLQLEKALTGESNYMSLSGGFLNDYVGERKLSKDSGKASFDMIGGIIDLSILNRFDIYTTLGSTLSPELKGSILGTTDKLNFSDSFMWGVGADAVIYDWKDAGIQFFGDGNYRQSTGLDLDSVTVNGTTYSKSQFTGASASAKWQEWQTALGVSKTFKYVIPYGGIVYSDVKTSAKATVSGTTYDLGSVSSKCKVGPFVGVSIIPTKWLSIDITGRFVAEEAVSVSVNVKF